MYQKGKLAMYKTAYGGKLSRKEKLFFIYYTCATTVRLLIIHKRISPAYWNAYRLLSMLR